MAGSDTERLHQLGYAQELRRGMRTFSNFAVSFTIISILSGCLTLFGFAMNTGGPAVMTIGWLVVGVFVALVALGMAEVMATRYEAWLQTTRFTDAERAERSTG